MVWNWQKSDWPNFQWDLRAMASYEEIFIKQSGVMIGVKKHLHQDDEHNLKVDFMTNEALKTSEIEGEYLDRFSVQSSIKKAFGLQANRYNVKPAERGIADLMTSLYKGFSKDLTHEQLHSWHKMITNGRYDLDNIGCYRTHKEPMQVISGRLDKPKIHFEAPPSHKIPEEMNSFLHWWQKTLPGKIGALPPLTRAGIAHLYFVSIHPYEDGNGRIARALTEKILAEHINEPTFIALSLVLQKKRKKYYEALEKNNKDLVITNWLIYFAETILEAQKYSIATVEFLLKKTKLFDRMKNQLNIRQVKVIERIFREGVEGFKGGLSADNYINITKTSRATATRDLQDLVSKKVLRRVGALKATRYYLKI